MLLSKHRMNSVSNKDLSGKKPSCLMNKQSKILVQCMTDYLLQHFAWATVRKVIIIMYFVLLTLWVPEFFDDSWRAHWSSFDLKGGHLFEACKDYQFVKFGISKCHIYVIRWFANLTKFPILNIFFLFFTWENKSLD